MNVYFKPRVKRQNIKQSRRFTHLRVDRRRFQHLRRLPTKHFKKEVKKEPLPEWFQNKSSVQ